MLDSQSTEVFYQPERYGIFKFTSHSTGLFISQSAEVYIYQPSAWDIYQLECQSTGVSGLNDQDFQTGSEFISSYSSQGCTLQEITCSCISNYSHNRANNVLDTWGVAFTKGSVRYKG